MKFVALLVKNSRFILLKKNKDKNKDKENNYNSFKRENFFSSGKRQNFTGFYSSKNNFVSRNILIQEHISSTVANLAPAHIMFALLC